MRDGKINVRYLSTAKGNRLPPISVVEIASSTFTPPRNFPT